MQNQRVDWLYIDMNSFFASCEQQAHPELRNKPLAVVPMMAETTFCLAASYEAKSFGVKTGVRVREAKQMCPGLKLITAHHDLYVHYHHALIEAVESCVPVHSVCSIDEICCELTGSQKNLATAQQLVQKIKATIKSKLGESLRCSIGLGPNILLSKMAADMQKPDGLTWLLRSELPHKLYPLKTSDVPGIGRKMEARLIARGVTTMEQLLNLNEQQMRALWGGIVGARYYRLLKGEHIDLQRQHTQSIGHEHVIPPKERNQEGLQIIGLKLISKAAVRLRRSQKMTKSLHIYVRFMSGQRVERSYKFHETQDTSYFIKLLLQMLQETWNEVSRQDKPFKMSIALGSFVDAHEHQLSLFEDDRRNTLFKAVDQINNRYGKNTIYVGTLQEKQDTAPTRIAFSRIPELDEL